MNKEHEKKLRSTIRSKALRKLSSKRRGVQGVWFGLGMMGLIGWSVTIPTLIGAAVGYWLDSVFPGNYSWTLTIMIAGLIVGCVNAWRWVRNEMAETEKEDADA